MRFNKTSDFVVLADKDKIDGHYFTWTDEQYSYNYVYRRNILNFFGNDTTEFVHIKTEDKDKLIISYINKEGKQERVYKGKLKKKFFEIYHSKEQFYIPLIISRINISRVRIGKTKKGELLINHFADQSGNLLMLAGGWAEDKFYRFRPADIDTRLNPVMVLDKWGYADSLNNILIPGQYDYASPFENGIAQVKLKDKWGIIDKQNQAIIPCEYDKIMPISGWGFKVSKNDKFGILDNEGKEKIPVIYDYIGLPKDGMAKIHLGEKSGYITKDKIIIPAIYSYIYDYSKTHFVGERDGQRYMIDKEGYEYGLRGKNQLFKKKLIPDPDTKRKILLEEQKIYK